MKEDPHTLLEPQEALKFLLQEIVDRGRDARLEAAGWRTLSFLFGAYAVGATIWAVLT